MGMCVRRPLVIASPETDIKTGYKVSLCNDEGYYWDVTFLLLMEQRKK